MPQHTFIASLLATFSLTAAQCQPGPGVSHHDLITSTSAAPYQQFKSSTLTPTNLNVTSTNGKPLAPGFIFITPSGRDIKQSAPTIWTDKSELVYATNVSGTTDFRMQVIKGTPYLTYWSGYNTNGANVGHGYGGVNIVDNTYKLVNRLCPKLGLFIPFITPRPECEIDIHEHQVTSKGTILVSAYNTTQHDLTAIGGPADGWINDCLFFELDPFSGEILFKWSAIEHVPVTESHLPFPGQMGNGTEQAPYDYFHINSVALLNNNYLVNSRHTWGVYLVDNTDGHIIWTLKGFTGGDFGALPTGGTFRWQHFVRAWNVTDTNFALSIFNNANFVNNGNLNPTRGIELQLPLTPDPNNTPPVLLRNLQVPGQPLYTVSQGSYSPALANGNQLMGYGALPVVREYGPATDGSDLRWEARFGQNYADQSYRAFKQVWHATPAAYDPTLVVEKDSSAGSGCGAKAYVSWNGATDVAAWRVYYAAASGQAQRVAGTVPFRGFETQFDAPASGCVQVGAIQGGQEVRRSNTVCL